MPIELYNLQKKLSPKEVACLSWLAQGKTIEETALLMGKRYSTIRSYLERIKDKLSATRISQLVYLAAKKGII